jgi:hypothetical protein
MAADIDTGMDVKDMRQILHNGGTDGVNCAFSAGDGGYALLRLDRNKGSPALAKSLKGDFGVTKVFQGRAFLDAENNKKVVFLPDGNVPGMAKKLLKTLKLASFKKVAIQTDGGAEESADDEEEGAPQAAQAPAASPAAAPDDTDDDADDDTGEADDTQAAAPPAPAQAAAVFAKAQATSVKNSKAWVTMANAVHGQIDKVQTTVIAAFEGTDMAAQLETAFKSRVGRIKQYDRELVTKLMAISKAKDADEQATLIADAKTTLQKYQKFIDSDTTLKDIDANPFVKGLTISDTVGSFLSVISNSLD